MSNAFVLLGVLGWLAAGQPSAARAPESQPTSAATAPSTQPVPNLSGASPLEMWVASVGLCVLLVYGVYRWARPAKLKLSPVPRRANEVHVAHVLLLYAFYLLAQGCLALYLLPPLLGEDKGPLTILAASGSQILWLPAIFLVARMTFPKGLARGMGLSARHWFIDGLRAVIAYLAVFPVCLLLWWLAMPKAGGPVHTMIQALHGVGFGWKMLDVLSAVALAPLAEEMFFRGLLQSMLRRYRTSPWPAVALASLIFAATHLGPNLTNWQWVPALTALGLVLGYNYERTGRLMAPILIHSLFNGVTMASQLLSGR